MPGCRADVVVATKALAAAVRNAMSWSRTGESCDRAQDEKASVGTGCRYGAQGAWNGHGKVMKHVGPEACILEFQGPWSSDAILRPTHTGVDGQMLPEASN